MYQAPPPQPDDLPPPNVPPRREIFGWLALMLAMAGVATWLGFGEFQRNFNFSAAIVIPASLVWSVWRAWRRSR